MRRMGESHSTVLGSGPVGRVPVVCSFERRAHVQLRKRERAVFFSDIEEPKTVSDPSRHPERSASSVSIRLIRHQSLMPAATRRSDSSAPPLVDAGRAATIRLIRPQFVDASRRVTQSVCWTGCGALTRARRIRRDDRIRWDGREPVVRLLNGMHHSAQEDRQAQ